MRVKLCLILFKLYGGMQYVAMIRSNDIFMQFRPWMADRSIVIVDEVKINDSKREANKQADELKVFVLKKCIWWSQKVKSISGNILLFMSSNHSMKFLTDRDTRRYFVMKQEMKRQQVREKYPNHYDDLVAMSEDDEAIKHLRHYLKHEWKISDYFLKQGFYEPMKTEAFYNIIKDNQSQLHKNLEKVRSSMRITSPFETPIHRVQEIYDWCLKEDKENGESYYKNVSENEVRDFLNNVGEQLNKGNDIPNMFGGGEKDRTRGWFATGEYAEQIAELKPKQWRLIVKKLDVAEFLRKRSKKKCLTAQVSDHPILKNGTDND